MNGVIRGEGVPVDVGQGERVGIFLVVFGRVECLDAVGFDPRGGRADVVVLANDGGIDPVTLSKKARTVDLFLRV